MNDINIKMAATRLPDNPTPRVQVHQRGRRESAVYQQLRAPRSPPWPSSTSITSVDGSTRSKNTPSLISLMLDTTERIQNSPTCSSPQFKRWTTVALPWAMWCPITCSKSTGRVLAKWVAARSRKGGCEKVGAPHPRGSPLQGPSQALVDTRASAKVSSRRKQETYPHDHDFMVLFLLVVNKPRSYKKTEYGTCQSCGRHYLGKKGLCPVCEDNLRGVSGILWSLLRTNKQTSWVKTKPKTEQVQHTSKKRTPPPLTSKLFWILQGRTMRWRHFQLAVNQLLAAMKKPRLEEPAAPVSPSLGGSDIDSNQRKKKKRKKK